MADGPTPKLCRHAPCPRPTMRCGSRLTINALRVSAVGDMAHSIFRHRSVRLRVWFRVSSLADQTSEVRRIHESDSRRQICKHYASSRSITYNRDRRSNFAVTSLTSSPAKLAGRLPLRQPQRERATSEAGNKDEIHSAPLPRLVAIQVRKCSSGKYLMEHPEFNCLSICSDAIPRPLALHTVHCDYQ